MPDYYAMVTEPKKKYLLINEILFNNECQTHFIEQEEIKNLPEDFKICLHEALSSQDKKAYCKFRNLDHSQFFYPTEKDFPFLIFDMITIYIE